jgi:hypothetical protein
MLTEAADIEADFRKPPRMTSAPGILGMGTPDEVDHPADGRGRATTAIGNPATTTTDEIPANSGSITSRVPEMTAATTAT